jgi:hypothetical protein
VLVVLNYFKPWVKILYVNAFLLFSNTCTMHCLLFNFKFFKNNIESLPLIFAIHYVVQLPKVLTV